MRPYLAAGLAGLLLSACSSPTLRFEDPSALGFDAVPVTPIADVATTIAVHGAPDFLEVASVGSAWVMNPATASVQLITDDGVQDEVTGVNPIGAMCRAFGSLWTASKKRGQPGELVRIDPRTRRIEARMPVGMLSYESTLAAVGGKLWIGNKAVIGAKVDD